MEVVTRFAPSPTGFMHVGGIRTALFAYLWAKKNEGTFILRIEDTDKKREVPASAAHIEESLSWLGMDPDFGPGHPGPFGSCIQSERLESYRAYAEKLVQKRLAYPDPYTEAEVERFRADAVAKGRPFLFRDYRPDVAPGWEEGKALRFKVPVIKRYAWKDAVRGDLEAGEEALDDFVLIKADGYPTYNFAHIVDDHLMGVTHIFRADEFISSTPRFLSLYDALEIAPPVFVTLPPILRPDKTKKLGKRDGARDILEYQKEGYLPDALLNYIALLGWNPGGEQEVFDRFELIERFSLDRIQRSGATFDETKLKWFNREHLLRMPVPLFAQKAEEFLSAGTVSALRERGTLEAALLLMRDRIAQFGELSELEAAGEFSYFADVPKLDLEALSWKGDPSADRTRERLERASELLEAVPESEWNGERLKEVLFAYADTEGRGEVLWPVRYALTGLSKSPDPFTVATVLGKAETIARLRSAAADLKP